MSKRGGATASAMLLPDITVERYGGPLLYHQRPLLEAEFGPMWRHLKEVELSKAPCFLASVFNYCGNTSMPLHTTPGGLHSWNRAARPAPTITSQASRSSCTLRAGALLHHRALDPTCWAAQQVFCLCSYHRLGPGGGGQGASAHPRCDSVPKVLSPHVLSPLRFSAHSSKCSV